MFDVVVPISPHSDSCSGTHTQTDSSLTTHLSRRACVPALAHLAYDPPPPAYWVSNALVFILHYVFHPTTLFIFILSLRTYSTYLAIHLTPSKSLVSGGRRRPSLPGGCFSLAPFITCSVPTMRCVFVIFKGVDNLHVQCSEGVDNVLAVKASIASGKAALAR